MSNTIKTLDEFSSYRLKNLNSIFGGDDGGPVTDGKKKKPKPPPPPPPPPTLPTILPGS